MSVYKAIVAVASDIAKTGIGKDRNNAQQGYKFRGIDDVYNELAPLLAKHGLCILPRIISRECLERVNKNGNALFYVTVDAEFDFVSAEDGTKHTVKTYGEAMDSADKATNKAMSAAYKYAAFQAFCIPTEGDNDADATTHEVKPTKPAQKPTAAAEKPAKTAGPTEAQTVKLLDLCTALVDEQNPTPDAVLEVLTSGKCKTLAEIATHPAGWTGAAIGKAEALLRAATGG